MPPLLGLSAPAQQIGSLPLLNINANVLNMCVSFTALTPQITVVFPTFTSAEPSAVEMEPKRVKDGERIPLLYNCSNTLFPHFHLRFISPMFSVVVLNSNNSRPSGRQFSFWRGGVKFTCKIERQRTNESTDSVFVVADDFVTNQKTSVVFQRLHSSDSVTTEESLDYKLLYIVYSNCPSDTVL